MAVDGASAVAAQGSDANYRGRQSGETIGFAALGILPTVHLLAASSFDKFKVGHTAKDFARTTPLGPRPRSEMI
jgi:hypothetical protein